MTGYGRGTALFRGQQITVELNSVNRKQIEINLSLPRELTELEPRIRDEINAHISRGRLTVSVALHQQHAKKKSELNVAAARAHHQQLKKLQREFKLKDEITLDQLLRAPSLFGEELMEVNLDLLWPPIKKALQAALSKLLEMRKKEGTALAQDLQARMRMIKQTTETISGHTPEVMKRHREALYDRAKKAGLEIEPADERLLKEIVFFADRSDITEELTRFKSHLAQFQSLLKKDEPVGRTLEFMIQEMNREVNTIGSKANDLLISQSVVMLKTELEKIREQIQNVE